jgi:uncharacterized protein YpuA (DUF1002 family)
MRVQIKKLLASTLLAATLFSVTAPVVSAEKETVVDERWGKPTYIYGGGLTEKQVDQTAKLLGIEDRSAVLADSVDGQEVIKYLGSGSGSTSSLISSVLVKKENEGTGVVVDIKTPENITLITKEQYANAAITAGVKDAKIVVASYRPVTGESALTGVYKAFDVNGEALDTKRTAVAQEELETVSHIVNENKKTEGFDAKKLDQAIVEIKQNLATLVDGQSKLATKEDIERIVNEALEKFDLQEIVSQDNVNQLIVLFQNYQQTSAIDSEEVKEQLGKLGTVIGQKAGEIYKDAKESGLIDQILSFFSNLFEEIRKLFE